MENILCFFLLLYLLISFEIFTFLYLFKIKIILMLIGQLRDKRHSTSFVVFWVNLPFATMTLHRSARSQLVPAALSAPC